MKVLSPEQIKNIRNLRACNVPWPAIAREIKASVQECRAAIGMPQYDKPTERTALPWNKSHQTLPFGK